MAECGRSTPVVDFIAIATGAVLPQDTVRDLRAALSIKPIVIYRAPLIACTVAGKGGICDLRTALSINPIVVYRTAVIACTVAGEGGICDLRAALSTAISTFAIVVDCSAFICAVAREDGIRDLRTALSVIGQGCRSRRLYCLRCYA